MIQRAEWEAAVNQWKGSPAGTASSTPSSRGRRRASPGASGRTTPNLKADELKRRSDELQALRQQLDAAANALVPVARSLSPPPAPPPRSVAAAVPDGKGTRELETLYNDVRADHEELRKMMEGTIQLFGRSQGEVTKLDSRFKALEAGSEEREGHISFMETEANRLKELLDNSTFADDPMITAANAAALQSAIEAKQAKEAASKIEKGACAAAAEASARILLLESQLASMQAEMQDAKDKAEQRLSHERKIADSKVQAAEAKVQTMTAKIQAASAEVTAKENAMRTLEIQMTQMETATAGYKQQAEEAQEGKRVAQKAESDAKVSAKVEVEKAVARLADEKAGIASKAMNDVRSAVERAAVEKTLAIQEVKADATVAAQRAAEEMAATHEAKNASDLALLDQKHRAELEHQVTKAMEATKQECRAERDKALQKLREADSEAAEILEAEMFVQMTETKEGALKAREMAVTEAIASLEAQFAVEKVAAEGKAASAAKQEAEVKFKADLESQKTRIEAKLSAEASKIEAQTKRELREALAEVKQEGQAALEAAHAENHALRKQAVADAVQGAEAKHEEWKQEQTEEERVRKEHEKKETLRKEAEASQIAASLEGMKHAQISSALAAMPEEKQAAVLSALPAAPAASALQSWPEHKRDVVLSKIPVQPRVAIEKVFGEKRLRCVQSLFSCVMMRLLRDQLGIATALRTACVSHWHQNAMNAMRLDAAEIKLQRFEDGVKHCGISLLRHILLNLVSFRQRLCLERFRRNSKTGIDREKKDFHTTARRHAEALEDEPPDHQYAAISVMPFKLQVQVLEELSDASRANVMLQTPEEQRVVLMEALSPQSAHAVQSIMAALTVREASHTNGARAVVSCFNRMLHGRAITSVRSWLRNWWSANSIPRSSAEAVIAMMQTRMSTSMVQKIKVVFKQVSTRLMVVCWNRLKAGVPDQTALREAREAKAESLYAKMASMSLGQRMAALKLLKEEDIIALLEAMPDEERADILLALELAVRERLMGLLSKIARIGVEAVIFRLEFRAQQRRASVSQMKVLLDSHNLGRLATRVGFLLMVKNRQIDTLKEEESLLRHDQQAMEEMVEKMMVRTSASEKLALGRIGDVLMSLVRGPVGLCFHRLRTRAVDAEAAERDEILEEQHRLEDARRNAEIAKHVAELNPAEGVAALSMLEDRGAVLQAMKEESRLKALMEMEEKMRQEAMAELTPDQAAQAQEEIDRLRSLGFVKDLALQQLNSCLNRHGTRHVILILGQWRSNTAIDCRQQLSRLIMMNPRLLKNPQLEQEARWEDGKIRESFPPSSPMRRKGSSFFPGSPIALNTTEKLKQMKLGQRNDALVAMPTGERVAAVAAMVHQANRLTGLKLSNSVLMRRKQTAMRRCTEVWKRNLLHVQMSLLNAMDDDLKFFQQKSSCKILLQRALRTESQLRRDVLTNWRKNMALFHKLRLEISHEDSAYRWMVKILRGLMTGIQFDHVEQWRNNWMSDRVHHLHSFQRVEGCLRRMVESRIHRSVRQWHTNVQKSCINDAKDATKAAKREQERRETELQREREEEQAAARKRMEDEMAAADQKLLAEQRAAKEKLKAEQRSSQEKLDQEKAAAAVRLKQEALKASEKLKAEQDKQKKKAEAERLAKLKAEEDAAEEAAAAKKALENEQAESKRRAKEAEGAHKNAAEEKARLEAQAAELQKRMAAAATKSNAFKMISMAMVKYLETQLRRKWSQMRENHLLYGNVLQKHQFACKALQRWVGGEEAWRRVLAWNQMESNFDHFKKKRSATRLFANAIKSLQDMSQRGTFANWRRNITQHQQELMQDMYKTKDGDRAIAQLSRFKKTLQDRHRHHLVQSWRKKYDNWVADLHTQYEKNKAAMKQIVLVLSEFLGRVVKVRFELWRLNLMKAQERLLKEKVKAKRYQAQVAALVKMRKLYAEQLMGGVLNVWQSQRLEDIAMEVANLQVQETMDRMRKMRVEFEKEIQGMEDDYDELEASYKDQQREIMTLQEDVFRKSSLVKQLRRDIAEAGANDDESTEDLREANAEVSRANAAVRELKGKLKKLEGKMKMDEATIASLESQLKIAVPLSKEECEECGNVFLDDAVFCRKCGTERHD